MGQLGRFRVKKCCFLFLYVFWHFFAVFHQNFFVFIIFISFLDEVSNFCNRTLTNQKLELVIIFQWTCMNGNNCEKHRIIANYKVQYVYSFPVLSFESSEKDSLVW